jgi:hypothetical protein
MPRPKPKDHDRHESTDENRAQSDVASSFAPSPVTDYACGRVLNRFRRYLEAAESRAEAAHRAGVSAELGKALAVLERMLSEQPLAASHIQALQDDASIASSDDLERDRSSDDDLASDFDPVPIAALEAMFPADGMWKGWAVHASENGLASARCGRNKFNPYFAGQWFLMKNRRGWTQAKFLRVMADNLPARSADQRELYSLGGRE